MHWRSRSGRRRNGRSRWRVREDLGARAAYFAQHPGKLRVPLAGGDDLFVLLRRLRGAPYVRPRPSAWHGTVGRPDHDSADRDRRSPIGSASTLAASRATGTVGHTLVIGKDGIGQDARHGVSCWRRRSASSRGSSPFDKDRGLETALRALGGSYSAVQMGVDTGFKPVPLRSRHARRRLAHRLARRASRA